MNSNYPPGVNELPDDRVEEEDYFFEVFGEVAVLACSEEDAEVQLKENLREIVADAVRNGDVEIR